MLIRKVRKSELNKVIEMKIKLYQHSRNLENKDIDRKEIPRIIKAVRASYSSFKNRIFVCEIDQKIIGFISISVNFYRFGFKIKFIGSIGDFFIYEKYRGRGIGSKLKKIAFRWFKKWNCSSVSLKVHPKNISTQMIYENWGFIRGNLEMVKRLSKYL
jgi:(aminoalkyl)phosphonate N-acetyltransferase